MVIKGYLAKRFFKKALSELDSGVEFKLCKHLIKSVGGYWKEGQVYIAFDNYSGDLFVEEFDNKDEAIKYANGETAITKGGYSI